MVERRVLKAVIITALQNKPEMQGFVGVYAVE